LGGSRKQKKEKRSQKESGKHTFNRTQEINKSSKLGIFRSSGRNGVLLKLAAEYSPFFMERRDFE